MITLRKITLENRRAIFNLEVSDDQRRFVASNLSSMASCYVLVTNGGQITYPLKGSMKASVSVTAAKLLKTS